MYDNIPQTKDLLLIGGGHAHALVLRQWGMKPVPGVRLTVINPHPVAPYSGMLPGLIASHYTQDQLEIDLVRLARFAGARVILDRVTDIDTTGKIAHLAGRPPIAFDTASVDIGITTEIKKISGADTYAIPAKPLDVFASRWEQFVRDVSTCISPPNVAVIGAGVAGVELAMAMAYRLQNSGISPDEVSVNLIERGPVILANASDRLRRMLEKQLARLGVTVMTGKTVNAITSVDISFEDRDRLLSSFTVTAIGANPADWLDKTDLALEKGFIRVDEQLRSISHKDIFAVGDIAHMDASPRVKAGVFAVRQAPVLYDNMVAVLTGGSLKPYKPQEDYLKLISLGGKSAVASKWNRAARHTALWKWKDRIDRTFMAQFRDLPAMPGPELPDGPVAEGVKEYLAGQPLCGGCGAKVAPDLLAASLQKLPEAKRSDIIRAIGDDAAVLKFGDETAQVLTMDHFRAFTPDAYLLSQIITLHALNDVWAMGADPQAILSAITLPRMSAELQARTLEEILAGIQWALKGTGAELVGGHTSLGAEMSLGITATGLLSGLPAIDLEGAEAGDHLILTKPIGTGTMLAAEMQGKVNGHHLALVYDWMLQSGSETAVILRNRAHAMTDISGFGLAGHLNSMMLASGTAARLSLNEIAYFDGAIELADQGIHSSIYADMVTLSEMMDISDEVRANPRFKLLFDPQTSGGLLAAIPPMRTGATLKSLSDAGLQAWHIGEVVDADDPPGRTCIKVQP